MEEGEREGGKMEEEKRGGRAGERRGRERFSDNILLFIR